MEGVAAAAAGEVTKCGIVHLEREFGYLVHFRRTVVKLREMHGKLADATNDVRTLIYAAGNNGDVIRETVQGWQRRAEVVQEEAAHLIAEAGAVNSWFKGWWCCSRFSIGRKAEKKNAEIQALLDEKSGMGGTVADPKPSQSLPLVSAGDFDAFASRVHTTQEVIQALNDERIRLVGVYGMPGVGKTMLIKALAKQVKEDSLFNEVVVVVVSQFPDLKKVQGDIARSLDLNLPEGDTSLIRAARLFDRLGKGKKVLIVLDDLWERLELAEIGIPLKNNDNRRKVVFTTRNQAVCDKMETDLDIEVELLSKEDSLTLFCQKAAVEGSGISKGIVKEIVNECGRLPLAIVTLASALRNNKKEAIWKDTLTQLKKSRHKDMEPVFSSLQLSFNFLPNDETKMCFLLCCLFPGDYWIPSEDLLSYMWGENLFEDVDTVREAKGKLLLLLHELTSSNLLLLISLVPANLLVRLQNLESLTVDSCPSLKELIQFEEGEENRNFPSSPIFPNLKDLTIVCCTKLKIIFGGDSNEGSTSTAKNKLLLPKLRRLFLMNLPQLSTISLPSLMVDCPSLEKFHVTKCLHLKKLPFDTASVPNLKALEASGFWFNSLEWDDEDTKSLLKKALVFK